MSQRIWQDLNQSAGYAVLDFVTGHHDSEVGSEHEKNDLNQGVQIQTGGD
jgi:hypothetical protein